MQLRDGTDRNEASFNREFDGDGRGKRGIGRRQTIGWDERYRLSGHADDAHGWRRGRRREDLERCGENKGRACRACKLMLKSLEPKTAEGAGSTLRIKEPPGGNRPRAADQWG